MRSASAGKELSKQEAGQTRVMLEEAHTAFRGQLSERAQFHRCPFFFFFFVRCTDAYATYTGDDSQLAVTDHPQVLTQRRQQ